MFLAINLLLVIASASSNFVDRCPPFTPEANFNISKYTGIWYEIARIPTVFEPLFKCGTATNTLNSNGTMTILNQGIIAPGQNYTARILATVIDGKVPATFRLDFENGGVGGYSTLETDYKRYSAEYACFFVPGLGNVQFAFILSRSKTLKASKLKKATRAFAKIGVDVSKFVTAVQDC